MQLLWLFSHSGVVQHLLDLVCICTSCSSWYILGYRTNFASCRYNSPYNTTWSVNNDYSCTINNDICAFNYVLELQSATNSSPIMLSIFCFLNTCTYLHAISSSYVPLAPCRIMSIMSFEPLPHDQSSAFPCHLSPRPAQPASPSLARLPKVARD